MWNKTHSDLLRQIIVGTDLLKRTVRLLSSEASIVLHANARSLEFKELLELTGLDTANLPIVHTACKFLLYEFGQILTVENIKHGIFPLIEYKHKHFGSNLSAWSHFFSAYEKHQAIKTHLMRRGLVDCLFVTAFPTEYLAVVRRLDHFIEGTDPEVTRGFIDNSKTLKKTDRLPVGWVLGGISRRGQSISVGVVCSEVYGPAGASSAVDQFLLRHPARHVISVGVGASLGSPSEFDLGDVAYSTWIDDIHLPKYQGGQLESEKQFTSETRVSSEPQWRGMRDELRNVLRFENGKLILTGILQPEDADSLQKAFSKANDKEEIRKLVRASQRKSERIDFKTNKMPIRSPFSMVKIASLVANSGRWRSGIKLAKPKGSRLPRVKDTRVLSGSAVVKAYGIREQLRREFKGRLLVEMEGAGVAMACKKNRVANPLVIKSACDWATPEKAKSWQPYCADVAASFAVEVAWGLAKSRKGA